MCWGGAEASWPLLSLSFPRSFRNKCRPHPPPASTGRPASVMNPGVSLYGIIADWRREHPTPAATQTLDMVVAELGRHRDNLKEAVAALKDRPLPPGGKPVLDELVDRALKEGVYDLDYGPDPYDAPPPEPLDEGTA